MIKQLAYKDIALRPERCIVDSRENCKTDISLGGKNFVMPVCAANMKSVVDINTCKFFAEKGWFYIMHRFDVNVGLFIAHMKKLQLFTSISVGINSDSYNILKDLLKDNSIPDYITVDVANAWSDKTMKMTSFIKENFPNAFLIVGNVATGEAVEEIEQWGVSGIKIGLAGGCFIAGTIIKTKNGLKDILDIKVGDEILTHRCRFKRVIGTSKKIEKDKLFILNENITCTGNHKFYVLNKKYKDVVNDDNIDKYAEWIEIENLSNNYYLLKIKKG